MRRKLTNGFVVNQHQTQPSNNDVHDLSLMSAIGGQSFSLNTKSDV